MRMHKKILSRIVSCGDQPRRVFVPNEGKQALDLVARWKNLQVLR